MMECAGMNVSKWGLAGDLWQALLDASAVAVEIGYAAPWTSLPNKLAAHADRTLAIDTADRLTDYQLVYRAG
jgi:hypothetical protein